MATIQAGEYVRTMGRQVATVVVAGVIARSVIGDVIWWAAVAVGQGEIVRRARFQGPS